MGPVVDEEGRGEPLANCGSLTEEATLESELAVSELRHGSLKLRGGEHSDTGRLFQRRGTARLASSSKTAQVTCRGRRGRGSLANCGCSLTMRR